MNILQVLWQRWEGGVVEGSQREGWHCARFSRFSRCLCHVFPCCGRDVWLHVLCTCFHICVLCTTTLLWIRKEGRKEGNVLFNDAFNTFYLRLYGVGHMVKDHSAREETRCHHYMGYFFRLAARGHIYAPSHRQDSTYHGLCYTRCVSMGWNEKYLNGSTMKDESYDPLYHEWTLLPQSYILEGRNYFI